MLTTTKMLATPTSAEKEREAISEERERANRKAYEEVIEKALNLSELLAVLIQLKAK